MYNGKNGGEPACHGHSIQFPECRLTAVIVLAFRETLHRFVPTTPERAALRALGIRADTVRFSTPKRQTLNLVQSC